MYNEHSLLISRVGFQSDSLQNPELNLGELVLICRMRNDVIPMLLCFSLIRENRRLPKQDSLKKMGANTPHTTCVRCKRLLRKSGHGIIILSVVKVQSFCCVGVFNAFEDHTVISHKEGHERRLVAGSVLSGESNSRYKISSIQTKIKLSFSH